MVYRSFLTQASTALLLFKASVIADSAAPFIGQKFSNVQGTFWRTNGWTTSCLFDNWKQPLPYYTAITKELYQNAAYCGVCVAVTRPNSSKPPVIGVINDVCTDCPQGALDLAPEFYNAVMGDAPNRPGKTNLSWKVVACPFKDKSIVITKKDGSSIWHLSLQIAGTINPLRSVEILARGALLKAVRTDYNFWELPDYHETLPNVIKVRVTCSNNVSFTVDNVNLQDKSPMKVPQNC